MDRNVSDFRTTRASRYGRFAKFNLISLASDTDLAVFYARSLVRRVKIWPF